MIATKRSLGELAREQKTRRNALLRGMCERVSETAGMRCERCGDAMRLRSFGPEINAFEFRCDRISCWPPLPDFWRDELAIMDDYQRQRTVSRLRRFVRRPLMAVAS